MKRSTAWFGATVLALLMCLHATARAKEALVIAPYTGKAGYQEIVLGPDAWYLAFHGTRDYSIKSVEQAWRTRAAMLCRSAGKPYLVELNYVGEPVFERQAEAARDPAAFATYRQVAVPVFVPLFIPSGPRNIPPDMTPSKQSAVACIATLDGLRTGKAAVPVDQALDEARAAGIQMP